MDKAIVSSTLPAFNEIELNHAFEVYLNEDSIYSIEIVGGDKIIEDIFFEVKDSVLIITNERALKWLTPENNGIEVHINSLPLSKVTVNAACNLNTNNPITSDNFGLILGDKVNMAELELNCGTFYYWNIFPSAGKMTLSGNADVLILWNFALMSIDASNLFARNSKVENDSKGDCQVYVSDKFEYSIRGIGDIHLYGKPTEILLGEITSTGQLIEH